MRNARRAFLPLLVLLVTMSAWQVLVAEAKAAVAEVSREADDQLRDLLTYSGPDVARQYESLATLQKILGYDVAGVHGQIIAHQNATQFGDRRKDLTLAFRGLGKSTTGTVVRAIAYILRNPNVRILIASATTEAPEEIHENIHGHLTTNETLIRLFGDFYTDNAKGKAGRFSKRSSTILQRADRAIGEGTITVLGAGKQAAMRHFDVVFADDLVTLETSRTKRQRANLSTWHGSTLAGTFMPHTKVHYIGTRYYPDDLWDVLVTGGPDQSAGLLAGAALQIPMVENFADPQDMWIPTCPERFDAATCVEAYRTMSRYHFLAQMQQDTSSGNGLIFSYGDFRWWGAGENEPPASAVYFQFSDLAAKKTETGDYFANCTVSVAQVGGELCVWVRDLVRDRLGMREQRETIISQIEKWHPAQAGIEAVQMQAGFAEEIQQGTLANVSPVRVETDKVFRARRVSHLVEGHRVFFPVPDSAAGRVCQPLVEELSRFPDSGNDDCTDAFVGALTLAVLGDWFAGAGNIVTAGSLEALSL